MKRKKKIEVYDICDAAYFWYVSTNTIRYEVWNWYYSIFLMLQTFSQTTDLSITVYSILDKELNRYLELKEIYVNDLRKFI